MRKLRIPNPILVTNERTYFDQDYSSGNTAIVVSSFTFAVNDIIIAGNVGEKKTEQTYISSLTPPTQFGITPAYNFDHVKGTTIYRSDYDYMSIEGQPQNGIFSLIQQVLIQWDKPETLFLHTVGDDTWNYRFRFYNSKLNVYSEYSPTIPGSGFTRQQVGQLVLNVRKKIRDVNRIRYSDQDIIYQLQDAQNEVITLIPKLWFLYVDTWETATLTGFGNVTNFGTGIPSVQNTTKYSLASWSDIHHIDKIRYYYNNGGAFLLWDLQPLPAVDFDRFLYNQNRIKNDIILSCKILPPDANSNQGYFEVDPVNLTNNVGYFYPVYWRKPITLVNMGTVSDFPYPEILEDYAAWKFHTFMGNDTDAKIYKDLFYGPSSETVDQSISGIKMLQTYNNSLGKASGYGKNLWNYRGKRGTGNFFGKGIVSRDFYKENYL